MWDLLLGTLPETEEVSEAEEDASGFLLGNDGKEVIKPELEDWEFATLNILEPVGMRYLISEIYWHGDLIRPERKPRRVEVRGQTMYSNKSSYITGSHTTGKREQEKLVDMIEGLYGEIPIEFQSPPTPLSPCYQP
ncbi:hypothetical protein CMO89_00805 [Candidatus Woesearchaeota archaeon]|nr:hypothetical protein [Candidatus Woesearchaeota archaeon]|tara:strand:- start:15142 stop:15549 length:408 start_codon:yes stop_codon:yes gene_type:complete